MSEAFAITHGMEVADIIMEHLPPEGWSDLATRKDLAEQGLLLRSDIIASRDELRVELAGVRVELQSEMAELRTEMAELRTELRTEMAECFARQLKWIVGTMIGLFAAMSAAISTVVVIAK